MPDFSSTLWMIVPIGMLRSGIALPGFTSTRSPAIDLVADGQTLRRQDVGNLVVLIADQRDEGGPVRIVFQALDRRGHVPLAALEIDDPVFGLVAATDPARRDASGVVAAALLGKPLGQRLLGLALVEARPVDDHQVTRTGGDRIELLECHRSALDTRGDVETVAFGQRHDRPLLIGPPARTTAEPLGLALADQRVDRRYLDVEQVFD